MENSINDIDNIIRDKLINYEEDASPKFWGRLNKRLSRNTISTSAIFLIAILTGLVFWMMMPDKVENTVANQANIQTEISEVNFIHEKEITFAEKHSNTKTEEVNLTVAQPDNKEINAKPKEASIKLDEEKVNINSIQISKNVIQNNDEFTKSNLFLHKIKPISIVGQNLNNTNQFNAIQREPESQNDYTLSDVNTLGKFSISMEVGYGKPYRTISSEPQFEGFKNYRIENEKFTSNLSYGIKLNYQYKNWVLSTGLDYTTISEELNYKLYETVVDPDGGYFNIDTIWAFFYNQEDNIVPMAIGYDRTWVDEYKNENYQINNTNHYSYIEIPVQLGYKFNFKKFSVCLSVGASFGFLYSIAGKLPLPNSIDFVELEKNSKYIETSITNLNLGLVLEYSITPNYGIYIKPFYKHGMNSIYKNYPLSVRYTYAGVKFGINIYL
ncbi:MAG: hypothetical protein HQ521_00410 [Bacteroidetes bacterium]|nr:hypothetical protein [Bacteroidota bacterium]